ncbi:MAG: hypothetical protein LQ342_006196 [Letrouitia transgressa]|nr:MAG: hypothetical protein LQ342_006196 [Letrouitia transgressa]
MNLPSISQRKHYRLVPGEPEEPTSTLVLTSRQSRFFVDVRVLKEHHSKTDALQWAFAGTSESWYDNSNGKRFARWSHWIDSKTKEPEVDQGEMITLENGDVLERGVNVDSVSGEETVYEELWSDLEILAAGVEDARVCAVFQVDDEENNARGLFVRVGGWCQSVLKTGKELTVERWEWVAHRSEPIHGSWERVVHVGSEDLLRPTEIPFDDPPKFNVVEQRGFTWRLVEYDSWIL